MNHSSQDLEKIKTCVKTYLKFFYHLSFDSGLDFLQDFRVGSGRLGEQLSEFLVGEPNFNLATTNEFFAKPNEICRTEMRPGKLHFEFRESRIFSRGELKWF